MSRKQVQMKTWPYAVVTPILSAGGYSHAAETATNNITSVRRTVAETRLRYQEELFELNAAEATLVSLLARAHMDQEER